MAKAAKGKRKVSARLAKPARRRRVSPGAKPAHARRQGASFAKPARSRAASRQRGWLAKPRARGKTSSLAKAVRSSQVVLASAGAGRSAAAKFGMLNSEIARALATSKLFRRLRLAETAMDDRSAQLSAEQARQRFQLVERDMRRALMLSGIGER